jgi:hypothetical protein
MTSTANLGLPLIEASQAQKHVTHNEALRILDAAIQIAVIDLHRTAPPPTPAAGDRHVVAAGATGAWAGHDQSIACWHDGAWLFLAPHPGWFVWSLADEVIKVFDGGGWHDAGNSYDAVPKLGVNTAATAPNLLSVRSNAALLTAIAAADGGSGDARLQLSKESPSKTASVVFSDNYSGRAEFGLIGSDAFKLKVSADGSSFVEAFSIDQASGSLELPRALALAGVIAPPQLTASQNDYNPTGLSAATVLRLSTNASRTITGIAGGVDGRLLVLRNVGAFDILLADAGASSTAANRFALGATMALRAGLACVVQYDGALSRWVCLGAAGAALNGDNLSGLAAKHIAKDNLTLRGNDIASASTLNLEAATGDLVDVTGNSTITAITLADGHERTVRFTAGLTLTHGASLVLPAAANIVTAAGDFAVFRGFAGGVVRCVVYSRANGEPLTRMRAKNITISRALNAASGNVSYTGVGFTPSAIVFFHDQFNTGIFGMGLADSTGITSFSTYNNLPSALHSGTLLLQSTMSPGGANSQSGALLSYDADGFTLVWTKTGSPPAETATIFALCLR